MWMSKLIYKNLFLDTKIKYLNTLRYFLRFEAKKLQIYLGEILIFVVET